MTTNTRPLRKKAKSPSREFADPFVDMLNEVPKRPKVAKIENILSLLVRAETYLCGWNTSDEVTAAAVDVSDFLTQWLASERCRIGYEEAIRKLNKVLKRYSWTSVIVADANGFKEEIGLNDPYRWEDAFIRVILDEIREFGRHPKGFISSFRKCIECNRWFMRSKRGPRGQKRCSPNCGKRYYSQSPEFKKKRAEYMRKRRKKEKDDEENSRRQAAAVLKETNGGRFGGISKRRLE
jgi:hypothetical protein